MPPPSLHPFPGGPKLRAGSETLPHTHWMAKARWELHRCLSLGLSASLEPTPQEEGSHPLGGPTSWALVQDSAWEQAGGCGSAGALLPPQGHPGNAQAGPRAGLWCTGSPLCSPRAPPQPQAEGSASSGAGKFPGHPA